MPSMPGTFKAAEDAKTMQIDAMDPAKTIQFGANLSPKKESELVDFLWCHKDIVAWRPIEMPSISWEDTEHTLSIKPGSKPARPALLQLGEAQGNR
jgi:hypothetical protein